MTDIELKHSIQLADMERKLIALRKQLKALEKKEFVLRRI